MIIPMSAARKQEIRERLERSTPGPWQAWHGIPYPGSSLATIGQHYCSTVVSGIRIIAKCIDSYWDVNSAEVMPEHVKAFPRRNTSPDADLIAHAPTDLADCLTEIERLEAAQAPQSPPDVCAHWRQCVADGRPARNCMEFNTVLRRGLEQAEEIASLKTEKDSECHCGEQDGKPVNGLACPVKAHQEAAIKQWKRAALEQQDGILTLRERAEAAEAEVARLTAELAYKKELIEDAGGCAHRAESRADAAEGQVANLRAALRAVPREMVQTTVVEYDSPARVACSTVVTWVSAIKADDLDRLLRGETPNI